MDTVTCSAPAPRVNGLFTEPYHRAVGGEKPWARGYVVGGGPQARAPRSAVSTPARTLVLATRLSEIRII